MSARLHVVAGILMAVGLSATGCGGSETGPSSTSSGTIAFDGQTIQGRPEGSMAFNRGPALTWVDLNIGTCTPDAHMGITLKGVSPPIALGTYETRTDAVDAALTLSGGQQRWAANLNTLNQFCGDGFGGGVLPACTPDSAGAGSATVSSSSSSRVSGSYRFIVVLPVPFSGFLRDRPPPVTKIVEGVFDLEFAARGQCS